MHLFLGPLVFFARRKAQMRYDHNHCPKAHAWRRRPTLLGTILLVLVFCHSRPLVGSDEPWDAPAFSADPGELLRAAAAVPSPDGADTIILFQETRVVLEANGRSVYTFRYFYRPLTAAGAREWAETRGEWEPWHQEPPAIRARVISPDQSVHFLDPKTIAEVPVASEEDRVYTDRKALEAPLPGVAVGAVVEEELVLRDTKTEFDRGLVDRLSIARSVPVHLTRFVIDAPASDSFRFTSHCLPSELRRSESAGRVVLAFETGFLDPLEKNLKLPPDDYAPGPQIAFSTGKSWQEVAARYSGITDDQIRDADLKELVRTAVNGKNSRDDKIRSMVTKLHKEVRYTGIEFSEASLVPRTPSETLKRKYGDCKDKAALLVAMLRTGGIPANLALLSSGLGQDVESNLPGMGLFDHAIVHVPGNPELWIDATDEFARIGEIPWPDQGRLALIIDPATQSLVRIPESTSSQNRGTETREFFLAETGPAHIIETSAYEGALEERFRADYEGTGRSKYHEQIENYVKEVYLAEKLKKDDFSDPRDFSSPFRIQLEMDHARRGLTDSNEAVVAIPLRGIVSDLPSYFRTEESNPSDANSSQTNSGGPSPSRPRRVDFVLPFAYSEEWKYRIVAPPGFKAKPLPTSATRQLGPAVLTQEFAIQPDGSVTGILRFELSKRRLIPAEGEALRSSVLSLQKEDALLIRFEQTGQALLATGKILDALAEFRALAAAHPKEALHHSQISLALLAGGMGEAARTEARLAVQLEPSATSYRNLGWILEHDIIGRRFRTGYDRDGAISAYKKAIELDPSDLGARGDLAILLEFDAEGERYTSQPDLEEAIRQYKSFGDKLSDYGLQNNVAFDLMYAHRWGELHEEALKLKSSSARPYLLLVARAAMDGSAAAIQRPPAIFPMPKPSAKPCAMRQICC